MHDGDGWHRAFDDPIPLPGAGELRTLRTKLPKREHDAPDWRAAIEALMLVAEHGGDTMLWRIGIMRALTFFLPRGDRGRRNARPLWTALKTPPPPKQFSRWGYRSLCQRICIF